MFRREIEFMALPLDIADMAGSAAAARRCLAVALAHGNGVASDII
jgi:hypothetical protein